MPTMESHNILITGLPGSGKTTLIRKLADELREYDPAGFYTEEIRTLGARVGFSISSLNRTSAGTLAHVDIKGPYRVGRYGVDLAGFERFLETLPLAGQSARVVIIDEIGKMECLSTKFRNIVLSLLDAPVPVIASIALKAGGFIDQVKHRQDVVIYEITRNNRDGLLQEIKSALFGMPLLTS